MFLTDNLWSIFALIHFNYSDYNFIICYLLREIPRCCFKIAFECRSTAMLLSFYNFTFSCRRCLVSIIWLSPMLAESAKEFCEEWFGIDDADVTSSGKKEHNVDEGKEHPNVTILNYNLGGAESITQQA